MVNMFLVWDVISACSLSKRPGISATDSTTCAKHKKVTVNLCTITTVLKIWKDLGFRYMATPSIQRES